MIVSGIKVEAESGHPDNLGQMGHFSPDRKGRLCISGSSKIDC